MQEPLYPFSTPQYIGPQLRAARERAGMKQTDLARLLGVDPAMVSRWEFVYSTRYVPVPLKHVFALANHLNIPLGDLAPGQQAPPPPKPTRLARVPDEAPTPPPEPANGRLRPVTQLPAEFAPSPVPGRPTRLVSGQFRVKLRCPWCRYLNTGLSDQPTNLPVKCLKCGARMRATVTVARIR